LGVAAAEVNRGAVALALALAACADPRAGGAAGSDGPGGGGSDGASGSALPPSDGPSPTPPRPDGGTPAAPDGPPSSPADAISPPDLPPPAAGRQRVNLVVTGPGRVVQVGGTFQCSASGCILDAEAGSRVTLHAEPEASAIPDAVSFLGWSGECTGRSDCTLTLDRDRPLVATFRRFLVWEQQVPATAVVSDNGGFYTWGTFSGTARIGSQTLAARGDSESLLTRLDHDGALQWTRVIGSTGVDSSVALALASPGRLFVFGDARGADRRFDTMPLWTGGDGSSPFFLSIVSTSGQLLQTREGRAFGGVATDGADSVVVVEEQNAGRLVKLDGQGQIVWMKPGLSPNRGFHKMPAIDRAGNVAALHPLHDPITLGSTTFTKQGQSDNLLVSYTPAGELRWAVQLGMDLSMGVTAMGFDEQNDLCLLIAFNGQLRIGGRSRTSVDGGQDIAVAKLRGAGGEVAWLLGWGSSLIDTPGAFSVGYRATFTATFQAPVQVASTRLEPGFAFIDITSYDGLESNVVNIGRDIAQLAPSTSGFIYVTKDGRIGRLTPF
jgi:hypothetical protein